MKIQQETLPFRPITIKLESRIEAEAMFSLMDKVCICLANENGDITQNMVSSSEADLAISISDTLTERKVNI